MTTLTSTLLLCSISTCCVWGLESSTVEVQSGQSTTLLCSNFTRGIVSISWYRAVRRSTLSRISVISSSSEPASYKDGSEDGRFSVTSNSSHIFLTISPVNSSDTGFYFCGHGSTMGLIIKDSTYLDVHEGAENTQSHLLMSQGRSRLLLLIPVAMVMTSALVFLTCRKRRTRSDESQAKWLGHTQTGTFVCTDQETTVKPRRSREETELYENVGPGSAEGTYQSLCVDTMDHNQTYSCIRDTAGKQT